MAEYCVAYHTKTGTSRDIAQKIADYLAEHDIKAKVENLASLENPGRYSGIILGGPINGMNLSPGFQESVERLSRELPPVLGVFAASITYNHGRQMWVRAIEKNESAAAEKLASPRWGVFGGRADKAMPAFARWIFGLPKDMPNDTVNWLSVINWCQEILGEIRESTAG